MQGLHHSPRDPISLHCDVLRPRESRLDKPAVHLARSTLNYKP